MTAIYADNAELSKWQGMVKKYEGLAKKYSSNFKKAKSLYSKAKKSGNAAKAKKYRGLAVKYQKSMKVAQARLKAAQAKVQALSSSASSGDTGNANNGGGAKITLTAEDRAMLKVIDSQKPLKVDPAKVLTFNKCNDCHKQAVQVWKKTPHHNTFKQLHKRPRAKEIVKKMGLKGSIKRNGFCATCHYTQQMSRGKPKAISGVSCESCHGASRDWVNIHNNKAADRMQRLKEASAKGMNNTTDVYNIAQNCYQCHSVGNEKLVNVGGHKAGSDNFEVVRWSQGMVRHNFVRGNNSTNAKSSIERLRVMFITGAMLDLEYGLRGVALATKKGRYYDAKMKRTNVAFKRLKAINSKSGGIPEIQTLLTLFKKLNFNNKKNLTTAANFITLQARKFTQNHDGSKLSGVDAALPKESDYKWKPTRTK
ncbi:cytochrome c554 [Candidatus Uabimicrobium amorphum]|uniref:Cytochrome c554 n=2 Tax=Uabimicrobium amorphum TaxID=2596890 RepID=A0A5S9IIU6_UABAM|nr:cytochrome c554 [Candidatus Uabimicrobium amorphum]